MKIVKTSRHYWTMIPILAVAVAVWAGRGLALGDDAEPVKVKPGKDRAEARAKARQAGKDLELTREQKEKLKPLLQEQREKLRAVRQDTNLSRAEKAAKVKALQDEMAPKLKEVLNAQQYERWQQRRQAVRGAAKKKARQPQA